MQKNQWARWRNRLIQEGWEDQLHFHVEDGFLNDLGVHALNDDLDQSPRPLDQAHCRPGACEVSQLEDLESLKDPLNLESIQG
jgi:hypothetical protein